MGLDFRHLQQIEAGTVNVTLATILKLCDAFDCSPSILLPSAREPKLKLGPGPPGRDWGSRMILPKTATSGGRLLLENPIDSPPTVDLVEAQKSVGAAIKRLREAKRPRLTQKRLAEVLSSSVQYVQMVEYGKQNLTIESLIKFAKPLGVNWRKLVVPDA